MEELRAESIRERLREFVSERDTALLERYVQIISEEFARALGLPKIMFGIVYSKRLIFEQINRFGTLRITNSGVFRKNPDIHKNCVINFLYKKCEAFLRIQEYAISTIISYS